MNRRSKIIRKGNRTRRPKVSKPKRVPTSNKASPLRSSAAGELGELARTIRERDEALEQQAAASQVLQLISSSPGDLAPVFTSILENARRICDVTFGILALFRDGAFQIAALKNPHLHLQSYDAAILFCAPSPPTRWRGSQPPRSCFTSRTLPKTKRTKLGNRQLSYSSKVRRSRRSSWCRCSKKPSWSEPLESFDKKKDRLQKNK